MGWGKEVSVNVTMITQDFFQTNVTSVREQKWFMETSQIIPVTSQMHSRPYSYQSSTGKHPAPFPIENAHTRARTCTGMHTHMHTLWCIMCVCMCFFLGTLSNKITTSTSDRLLIFFPVYAILTAKILESTN